MAKYAYGVRIRTKLLRLGKTQRQLARCLGYSPGHISNVLSERYPAAELREDIDLCLKNWEADRRQKPIKRPGRHCRACPRRRGREVNDHDIHTGTDEKSL